MSRGLGDLQKHVLTALSDVENCELPVRQLRRAVDEPDRSNLRRGVRGLIQRELAADASTEDERRVKLTIRGALLACILASEEALDPIEESRREWEEFRKALIEAKREKNRRREEKTARYPEWIGYSHLARRLPGPSQRLVLRCLWEYADPMCAGLPVTVVKSICGLEKSNGRRAIRGLLARGYLDETPDGERIRLSEALVCHYLEDYFIPAAPVVLEELDNKWAKMVLQEHGEDIGERLLDLVQ